MYNVSDSGVEIIKSIKKEVEETSTKNTLNGYNTEAKYTDYEDVDTWSDDWDDTEPR